MIHVVWLPYIIAELQICRVLLPISYKNCNLTAITPACDFYDKAPGDHTNLITFSELAGMSNMGSADRAAVYLMNGCHYCWL